MTSAQQSVAQADSLQFTFKRWISLQLRCDVISATLSGAYRETLMSSGMSRRVHNYSLAEPAAFVRELHVSTAERIYRTVYQISQS